MQSNDKFTSKQLLKLLETRLETKEDKMGNNDKENQVLSMALEMYGSGNKYDKEKEIEEKLK